VKARRCGFIAALFLGVVPVSPSHSALIISSDTTFTEADSPVDPRGDIIVQKGVTLTIEPGVTVYLSSGMYGRYRLKAYGTLKAIGTKEEPIVFKPEACGWQILGIALYDSTSSEGSELLYCRIGYASAGVLCYGTEPTISHCDINAETGGIDLYGTPDIVPVITHNYIHGCGRGIACLNPSPIIEYNTLQNAVDIAIRGESNPRIHYNNIRSKVASDSIYPIDARFNYWYTTDEAEIQKRVSLDIDYSGWLTAPVKETAVRSVTWGSAKVLFQ
jgi:hypothetical protein